MVAHDFEYAQKYGIPTTRNQAQVVQDAIQYAKDNGVSLTDAYQQNFVVPLQAKDEFKAAQKAIQDALVAKAETKTPNIERIGTDENGNPTYGYMKADGTVVSIGGSGTSTSRNMPMNGNPKVINQLEDYKP